MSHSWSCQTGKFIRSSYFFDELNTAFCWCEFERDERERDGNCLQARTLRLMANAYLEWDGQTYWQKALNAVGGYDPVSLSISTLLYSLLQDWRIRNTVILLGCC